MNPRAVVGMAILVLMPLLLLAIGGDWAWRMGWIYAGLYWVASLGSRLVALFTAPDLLAERGKFASAEDVPDWDRRLSLLVGLVGPLALLVVAGLDHRYGWTDLVPPVGQTMALGVLIIGFLFSVWAMLTNRFFGAVVRIQKERNHTVVDRGPYAFLRHPGYAGGLYATLATPFMLNTLWALVPALLMVGTTILRTSLEDRFLQDQLPGYTDYAKRVRSRLIPGLW